MRLLPFVRVRRNRDDRFRRFDWWRHFSVRDRTEPRQRYATFLLAPFGRTALIISTDPVYRRHAGTLAS